MNKIKDIIKKSVPNSIRILIEFTNAYLHDFKRYYKYSATKGLDSESKLTAKIILEYHAVEKGLTMPELRLGFGKDKIINLTGLCNSYIDRYGSINKQVTHAVSVIFEYKKLHDEHDFQLDANLLNQINDLKSRCPGIEPNEQTTTTKSAYFNDVNNSFLRFSNSRSSIRSYDGTNIPLELILNAVKLSKNAPSACNRQAARVHVYTDKKQINEILKIQNGSRGFGHLADKLIVVTAELGVFCNAHERNQAFIDGGIFAMNLLYALHFYQIGACILNCSNSPGKDDKLEKLCKINKSEVYIAMISCGNVPEKFRIATSKRNSLENIVQIN